MIRDLSSIVMIDSRIQKSRGLLILIYSNFIKGQYICCCFLSDWMYCSYSEINNPKSK